MRASFNSLLLAAGCLSAAWLAGAGCASAPKEEPPVAKESPCASGASDPLHMVSSRSDAAPPVQDPQIESILNQSADPRLAWVNRQMYQSLHALDVELRREQRIVACEHPEANSQTLEAQAGAAGGNGAGAGGGGGIGVPASPVPAVYGAPASPASGAPGPPSVAATPNSAAGAAAPVAASAAATSPLIRKTSLSAARGGGNGATAQKFNGGSDNDIVARRLRKAAEQETNPTLRAKLWKEYADYRQGMTAK